MSDSMTGVVAAARAALATLAYKTITLESASDPANDTGITTWSTSATITGFYEPQTLPGGQSLVSDPEAGYAYTFWISVATSVPTIKAKDRLTVDGLTFEVLDAPPLSSGGMLRVECVKIADTVL